MKDNKIFINSIIINVLLFYHFFDFIYFFNIHYINNEIAMIVPNFKDHNNKDSLVN